MPPAPLEPRFPAHGAPVSILVDYDGTISSVDIGDALLARHVADQAAVLTQDAAYLAGRTGSRDLMRWDMEVLPDDADLLRREAAEEPQDETFVTLVERARAHGAAVEIVSDGLGFYVGSNLARLGLGDLPVATNANQVQGRGAGMSFPYGHPDCYVCGTCKRERVRRHQAAGRAVVFIGDGASDRFAAAHADIVFAKGRLAEMCAAEGWPTRAWDRFTDVAAWLDAALADGRLPRDAGDLPRWRARHARAPRAFICGPEAWGPGRTTPGPRPPPGAG